MTDDRRGNDEADTRLWPMSRAALPKQLLPLVSEYSMLQETLLRLSEWPEMSAPVVVCGNDHRFLVAEQLARSTLLRFPSCLNRSAAIRPRLLPQRLCICAFSSRARML